jgi:hypothetical protein
MDHQPEGVRRDALFAELSERAPAPAGSVRSRALDAGVHSIGRRSGGGAEV